MAETERTDPNLWERIKKEITAKEMMGTKAGEWSARKAQYAVKEYKRRGGGYKGEKSLMNPLVLWTQQNWRTKSGLPSHITGERYLPAKAIEALSSKEYAKTSKAKRKGMEAGKQFVPQPKEIAVKTREFREK
jgi:hypothetical protein